MAEKRYRVRQDENPDLSEVDPSDPGYTEECWEVIDVMDGLNMSDHFTEADAQEAADTLNRLGFGAGALRAYHAQYGQIHFTDYVHHGDEVEVTVKLRGRNHILILKVVESESGSFVLRELTPKESDDRNERITGIHNGPPGSPDTSY